MSVEVKFSSDLSVKLLECSGDGDLGICAAAKVSTLGAMESNDKTSQAQSGLIRYLMKQRHGSPFEHNMLRFMVHVPIFVFREWHRHRIGWSYNEESGRYKVLAPLFYIPPPERPMFKVEDWKPGRPKFLRIDEMPNSEVAREIYENKCRSDRVMYGHAYATYLEQIEAGFDPGIARDCLPVGIYSSMYATCNARSLMHFLSLRTYCEEAEKVSYPLWEIDQAARQIELYFQINFPITHAAFVEFGRSAP